MTSVLIDSPRIAPRSRAWADDELARAAGRGDVAAFEALYERHHAALLSFARHMLGRLHDAEDVVQHTFAAADAAFREDRGPASVRAWLYTVARNRCISILRSRREDEELSGLPSAENLAEEVEQREDLRELLADLRTLPDDQRAALLLAELGELSHAEVAQVLGVRVRKVKALVYQARRALMAAAGARAIPCRSIQAELSVATGAARRRRHLRHHVARCEGCRSYADRVAAQRASLGAILPVVPTVALRDAVLACIGSGGAAAATGGAGAGLGVLGAKLLAITAIGGAAAGGGTVAVKQLERSEREPRAARSAAPARAPAAVAPVVPTKPSAPERGPAPAEEKRGGRRAQPTATRAAPPATGDRPGSKPATPPGLARGHAKQRARGKSSAGNARGKPERADAKSQAPPKSPGPPTAGPVRMKPAPPGQARKPPPARSEPPAPPAQAQPKAKQPKEPQVKTK